MARFAPEDVPKLVRHKDGLPIARERDLGRLFGQLPGAEELESVDPPDFHLLVIASGHKMCEC